MMASLQRNVGAYLVASILPLFCLTGADAAPAADSVPSPEVIHERLIHAQSRTLKCVDVEARVEQTRHEPDLEARVQQELSRFESQLARKITAGELPGHWDLDRVPHDQRDAAIERYRQEELAQQNETLRNRYRPEAATYLERLRGDREGNRYKFTRTFEAAGVDGKLHPVQKGVVEQRVVLDGYSVIAGSPTSGSIDPGLRQQPGIIGTPGHQSYFEAVSFLASPWNSKQIVSVSSGNDGALRVVYCSGGTPDEGYDRCS